jgi:hypothetical protein
MPEILRTDKKIEIPILTDIYFALRSYNDSQRHRKTPRQLSFRNYGADYDREFEIDRYYCFGISTHNLPMGT